MNVNSITEELKKLKTHMLPASQAETLVEEVTSKEVKEEIEQVEEVSVPIFEVEVVEEEKKELEEVKFQEDLEEVQIETEEAVPETDTQDLIEGIELASQFEFEQEPFMQTIESEQESLKKLAGLLSALDPGDDTVISPLTEKLMSLGDDEEISIIEETPILEEGLSDEEIAQAQEYQKSVSRLGKVLSAPAYQQEAAEFVSSIKETIAHVTKEKDVGKKEKSKLTKIIEAETGEEVEKPPVQTDDIQNIITHLESRREKAIQRIQQLEEALNTEKIDEEEWHELRIKAERHMLRIEDTLDGYKRYLDKLQSQ
ncbi:MAG: hypothetical protein ACXABK_02675 [Candidatus Heimdallarchaeaceae archaeon]|jgi:hypothetical protein